MTINQEEKLERVVFEKVLYMAQEEENMKYDGLQEFPYTHYIQRAVFLLPNSASNAFFPFLSIRWFLYKTQA